jgi:hypothetical protein
MTQDDFIEVDDEGRVLPRPDLPTWPDVPAVDGMVYGFEDPSNPGDKLVAMTFATWEKLERSRKSMTSRLEHLSRENIEMKQGRLPGLGAPLATPRIVLPDD